MFAMAGEVLTRNVRLLVLANVLIVGGSVLMVTLGGIVGAELAPTIALATLPMSLIVVGTAITTVPASMAMSRFGRRVGFAGAACLAAAAAAGAGYAVIVANFVGFCVASACIGIVLGFTVQFRFAAVESVPAHRASTAISMVLLGAMGGAFLGPALATQGQNWIAGHAHAGSLFAMSACYVIAAGLLLGIKQTREVRAATAADAPRPLATIVRQTPFIVAVLAGVVAQGTMVFVMTATPLSMHVMDGHSLEDTALVIQSHVLAMYAPSLISGYLVERLGVRRMMTAGAATLALTLAAGLLGTQFHHYWWSMVLLGLGWNFLFVGGTTLLVQTYRPSERFGAQSVNEFCVFTTSATASLLAGTVIYLYGWNMVLMACVPVLVAIAVALTRVPRMAATG